MGKTYSEESTLRGLAKGGDSGVRRVDSYRVDPRVLEIEPGWNVRFASDPELRAHIDSIKESIKNFITGRGANPDERTLKGGLLEIFPALVVKIVDGRIIVRDGHCRTIGVRELLQEGWDIQELDVSPTRGDTAEQVLLMVRSSQGKDLTPLEKAVAFARLADEPHNMTGPAIARGCGNSVTPQRVEQLVLLGRAPVEIHEWIAAKKLTADSAIETLRKHREHPEEAVAALKALVEGSANRVGKGQTRVAIPKKLQDGMFDALSQSFNNELARQLKDISASEGWEEIQVQVSLPAKVVQELLALQKKGGAVSGEVVK